MGSPEPRRKRRRSARARIGFRSSYEGGAGYCRRITRFPQAAVLFSLVMMVAVYVRKAAMSSARARSADLRARLRAKKSPLAGMLEEQHEIHYQAAALSDPSSNCLSHTNGGHKQPYTLGVFTCVADARFLLRALIVSHGNAPMLVVDVGSSPASDAGGITSGRGWDLRQSKQHKVNRRVKFREEPLPESSSLVLIESHKNLSADDWTDVVLSVLQLLTPDGSIVLMEQREKTTPSKDTESQYGAWPGSADLREAIKDLACGEVGLAVALGAFDQGIAVVRRAGAELSRLERGCILVDELDEIVVDDEPDEWEERDTAAASTIIVAAATGASSAATGASSAATGAASAATDAASETTGTGSDAEGTGSDAEGTRSDAKGTESDAEGTRASTTDAALAATGVGSDVTGFVSAATGTAAAAPTQPLLRFEELYAFAMGMDWTPEAVQTKFGGADAVKKYAHRAGSRLFCVKNLARDSEGTGLAKQTKKPAGDKGGAGKLRSPKRNDGGEGPDPTPEQAARACLENHMKKHPQDVRGAFVLEMVLQAGGGDEGVDVDRQVARLREDATTQRGEAGLSLWKALHARGASAGATGLLLP